METLVFIILTIGLILIVVFVPYCIGGLFDRLVIKKDPGPESWFLGLFIIIFSVGIGIVSISAANLITEVLFP